MYVIKLKEMMEIMHIVNRILVKMNQSGIGLLFEFIHVPAISINGGISDGIVLMEQQSMENLDGLHKYEQGQIIIRIESPHDIGSVICFSLDLDLLVLDANKGFVGRIAF